MGFNSSRVFQFGMGIIMGLSIGRVALIGGWHGLNWAVAKSKAATVPNWINNWNGFSAVKSIYFFFFKKTKVYRPIIVFFVAQFHWITLCLFRRSPAHRRRCSSGRIMSLLLIVSCLKLHGRSTSSSLGHSVGGWIRSMCRKLISEETIIFRTLLHYSAAQLHHTTPLHVFSVFGRDSN